MKVVLIQSYAEKPWRSPETYQMIEKSLREVWPVELIKPDSERELIDRLSQIQQQSDAVFVFNIAEFVDEEEQTGFIPKILDDINIPHLGSDAEAIMLGLNKGSTKVVLKEKGIPTPEFFVQHIGKPLDYHKAEEIGYPLFVKPLSTGGHLGVTENSIIQNPEELQEAIHLIHDKYNQAALVEAFINDDHMREFSVGVVGNDSYLFTPMEIDFDAMPVEERILSFDAAQKDLEVIKPVNEDAMKKELVQLALETFQAVGAKDYSRIDLRMDKDACYVLEINTMPGLGPHSFLPEAMADQHGMDYSAFIQKLVEVAIQS